MGLSACAESDPTGETAGTLLPEHYVEVVPALAELGLPARGAMTPEGVQVFGTAWHEMELRHDQREIMLDGRRIFLGEGVVAHQGRLWFSATDVDKLFKPLLRPRHYAATARPVRTIWIDAGHGGKDRGTHSDALNLSEKKVALQVALKLGNILSAQGFEVKHTRTEDVYIDIGERAEMSREADLLVSVHFNAAGNPAARGTEVYALTPAGQRSTGDSSGESQAEYPVERGNATDPWNALLAFAVHEAMIEGLGTHDRGLKRARFAVLRLTDVPAVLIEAGFLSHEAEARESASDAGQGEIAEAIANGIVAYANLQIALSPDS
jgi:N-acetylmuramoyl-L-alanine amidase